MVGRQSGRRFVSTKIEDALKLLQEAAQLQGAHGALQRQVEEQTDTIRRFSEQRAAKPRQAKQPE